ncbi:hypothetical protein [Lyngbya confervoides]|uniref:Uncharacterized protein n=1 Tax=Lyngbya confervoides BDU141951 TaxID=1574623 RepID=A0ABD4TA35_9CYAN|nr:hypothetical protein [Lyngbya confervoides]MCM1985122.1 hypothetical protein [Lyngbya confervoides BDU141951]
MRKIVGFFASVSFLIFADHAFAESPLLIYGSRGNGLRGIVFLGCVNCNKFDEDALANQFGEFGSQFSPKSIYNRFGDFGSQFSNVSACNPIATNPPVIVDQEGNFQGYLTLNRFVNGTVIDPRILGACL